MASKRERAPSGVADVTEALFHVPALPTILRADAKERILALLADRDVAGAALYLSDGPVRRGMLFDATGKRVAFPEGAAFERAYVALVDLDTEARWAHRALWVFVPAEGGDTPIEARDTNVPENRSGAVRMLRESRG